MGETNEPHDTAASRPGQEPATVPFESELDDMLARAASLADNLAGEVSTHPGAAERPSADVAPAPHRADQGATTGEVIEDEFGRIDSLLKETSTQLGSSENPPAPESDPPVDPASAGAPNSAQADNVPDFMKEFVASESSKTPSSSPGPSETITLDEAVAKSPARPRAPQRPLPTGAKPGVVGTGMLGVVRTNDETLGNPKFLRRRSLLAPVRRLVRALNRKLCKSGHPVAAVSHSLARCLGPPALVLARCVVCVLELMDVPMRMVNRRVRRFIGMVAVATLLTALIVHVVSLF